MTRINKQQLLCYNLCGENDKITEYESFPKKCQFYWQFVFSLVTHWHFIASAWNTELKTFLLSLAVNILLSLVWLVMVWHGLSGDQQNFLFLFNIVSLLSFSLACPVAFETILSFIKSSDCFRWISWRPLGELSTCDCIVYLTPTPPHGNITNILWERIPADTEN